MTNLLDQPALKYENTGVQRHFRITDPDGDQVLGNVLQIVGPEPRKGRLKRMFGSIGPDRSRVVVRVDRADGGPPLFIDRAQGQEAMAFQPPCAVVTPEGRLTGRIEHNLQSWAQSFIEGRGMLGGAKTMTQAHKITGPDGGLLCDITWEETRIPGGADAGARGGRYCDYTDANGNGNQLARYEGKSGILRLDYQLPEPLRTLIIMSPIAFGLMFDL